MVDWTGMKFGRDPVENMKKKPKNLWILFQANMDTQQSLPCLSRGSACPDAQLWGRSQISTLDSKVDSSSCFILFVS